MTWYPDWVVALDDTAQGKPNANVTPRNAQDAIRAIEKLTKKRDRLRRIERAARAVLISGLEGGQDLALGRLALLLDGDES